VHWCCQSGSVHDQTGWLRVFLKWRASTCGRTGSSDVYVTLTTAKAIRIRLFFSKSKNIASWWWWWWSCRWGETTSLNCGHQRAYCSFPKWYMSMNNHGGMTLTEENCRVFHQSFLEILLSELSDGK
jgi:hypothetical protein